MKSPATRYNLLRQAFCELPQKIGNLTLRPLSGGSFELLQDIQNGLVYQDPTATEKTLQDSLQAVHEYIWIHTAPLTEVLAVESRETLPRLAIRALAMEIEMGESLAFTALFSASALRMAAAMTELADEEDPSPGKPQTPPTGSPPSSSPPEPQETPSENVISFGTPPSSEPSPTSTLPTSPPEPESDSATPLMILPSPPPPAN